MRPEDGVKLTKEAFYSYFDGKIARYKISKYFRFCNSFPMTITGKIQKGEMQRISIAALGFEEAAKIKTAEFLFSSRFSITVNFAIMSCKHES